MSQGPIFLHRCEHCGTYWEVNLREAHIISEEEARAKFPQVFANE